MEQELSKPAPRRSVPMAPVNDDVVDEEVSKIFADPKAPAAAPSLDDFVARTTRSKVAIVVPMFGYWQDYPEFFGEDILAASVERVRSYAHNAYIIVVAESKRLPQWSARVLNKKFVAGNVRGIDMPVGSTYGDYVRKGMEVALQETDARFVVFQNPWVVTQDHGVDALIDRVNLPDNAPVICGYETHDKIKLNEDDAEKFLKYTVSVPDERRMLSFNFVGMTRYIAEMCPIDPSIRTQAYLERDFFQTVASKGYEAVSSERVPIWSWVVPWEGEIDEHGQVISKAYVPEEDYAHDAKRFSSKWRFTPEDVHKTK